MGANDELDGESLFWAVYNAWLCFQFSIFGSLWLLVAVRRQLGIEMAMRRKDLQLKATPQIAFVLPVKGTHPNSATNWISQVNRHGYAGAVEFVFVVQEDTDPAFVLLKKMQAEGTLPTEGVRVLVAGLTERTSQKLHNMIHAIENVGPESELVLMLDDDMLLNKGAVNWLVHELEDKYCLAASGWSCDVPAVDSIVCHAACMFRLALEISFSSGWANAAWGGCCMMRRADLLESVPDGVMYHWKNDGYSDDWIITQVARRHRKRIANPQCLLFLNLTDFDRLKRLYNFVHRRAARPCAHAHTDTLRCPRHARARQHPTPPHHPRPRPRRRRRRRRQIFVLDTYIESEGCECHRVESGILPHLLALLGLLFASTLVTVPVQLGMFCAADGSWSERAERVDRVLLFSILGGAMPLCYLGAYKAIKAQGMLINHLSPESGKVLEAEAKWSWWRAPLGFFLFNIITPLCGLEGYWSNSVVWSRVKYFKRRGRLNKIERIGAPVVHVAPASPPAVKSQEKLAVEGRLFSAIFTSGHFKAAAAAEAAEAQAEPPQQTNGHREHDADEIRVEVTTSRPV